MNDIPQSSYPLDNSAVVHLAAATPEHTNSFRFTARLTVPVQPRLLQAAVDAVTSRFPTILAGIRAGRFRHRVVPAAPPRVQPDNAVLAPMTPQQIERCAVRVLYRERQITLEIFHSLTDGYGALTLLKTLLAEYLRRAHGVVCPAGEGVLALDQPPQPWETVDDYHTYASAEGKRVQPSRGACYQMPGGALPGGRVEITARQYDAERLRRLARRYRVGLTALLAGVMAASVAEIQRQHGGDGARPRPVRLMVPVDLRRLFPSRTLRNFSLYALPCVPVAALDRPAPELAARLQRQMDEQLTAGALAAAMRDNLRLAENPAVQTLPWAAKRPALKLGHRLLGERQSCITLSNLGVVALPEPLAPWVEGVTVALTPRIASPYNCGVLTCKGVCTVTISRRCAEPELERCFFARLERLLAGL